MKEPQLPTNEPERLATLQGLQILDTHPEERFDRYTRLAASLFDVPVALVSFVDHERQWFKSAHGLEAQETPRSVSVCGHAILQNDTFVVNDLSQDERFFDNPLVAEHPGFRFYAGVVLQPVAGLNLGTLCILDYKPRTFDEQNQRDLIDLASMVSDELVVFVDELTGLTNRRGFNMLARQALSAARRARTPVSLAMLDLDGFKSINDRFGHQTGDHALKTFASYMTDAFRESDVISRFGGDEFCVIFPNAGKEEAEGSLERLRRSLGELKADPSNHFALAFSAGIIEADHVREPTIDSLVGEADRLLYEEKEHKRSAAAPDGG